MPAQGGTPENQAKPGLPTTTIQNKNGEWIAWDAIEEVCNVPTSQRNNPEYLTLSEAARKFNVSVQSIQAKARRNRWRTRTHSEKSRLMELLGKPDWGKRGEAHREAAFKVAHESLKKFKAKKPANFKELEIVDRIARKAAGLENESVVQQTLVHINEAVEDHANQVIEATEVSHPEGPALLPPDGP